MLNMSCVLCLRMGLFKVCEPLGEGVRRQGRVRDGAGSGWSWVIQVQHEDGLITYSLDRRAYTHTHTHTHTHTRNMHNVSYYKLY